MILSMPEEIERNAVQLCDAIAEAAPNIQLNTSLHHTEECNPN